MCKRMEKSPINDLMETTMSKVRDIIDSNTIIGDPISTADGITLIPISKLSFGFAGGGGTSDAPKKQEPQNGFGGGIGAAVKIEPVAFIVVAGESVKLLHIAPPAESTIDRLIETVPELFDKVTSFIKKDKDKDTDE